MNKIKVIIIKKNNINIDADFYFMGAAILCDVLVECASSTLLPLFLHFKDGGDVFDGI